MILFLERVIRRGRCLDQMSGMCVKTKETEKQNQKVIRMIGLVGKDKYIRDSRKWGNIGKIVLKVSVQWLPRKKMRLILEH